tara:strand:+ start:9264 stop:9407 length:144 start_codon:yes stop_codon:yes gene_type:complete
MGYGRVSQNILLSSSYYIPDTELFMQALSCHATLHTDDNFVVNLNHS